MAKYRVLEHNGYSRTVFEVQKKLWWGWWYNPLNVDNSTTGFYNTLPEAIDALAQHKYKDITTVAYTDKL